MWNRLTCVSGSGDGLNGDRMTSSFFMGLTLVGSGSTNNKSLLLLICVKLYLSDQFGGIISDIYRYWRTFSDSLISFPPQGALQNALTDANEPRLLHLKGCHLEFKDNKVNYLTVTQLYEFNYSCPFIEMERSSLCIKNVAKQPMDS